MFDSGMIFFWTNHNSLLSLATKEIASFCIDYRLHQMAFFHVCQSGQRWGIQVIEKCFEVKKLLIVVCFFIIYTSRFHVAVHLCSVIDHRGHFYPILPHL